MMAAPDPNERRRLQALRSYAVLDSSPEEALDDLTALAAHICGVPIALIALIDEDRPWFKSRVGVGLTETPLDLSFCKLVLRQPDFFIVPDTTKDVRFERNELPLRAGGSNLLFRDGNIITGHEIPELGLCLWDIEVQRLGRERLP